MIAKNLQSSLKTAVSKKNLPLTVSLIIITILFFGLRLWNFHNLATFHIDQAQHLLESKEMVDNHKIRLIGSIVTTRIVDGHGYFIGPHYYYILAAIGILTGWNVYLITQTLILMWWLSAALLTYWIGKQLNWHTATLAYFLMATSPVLIGFSRMFLNPNFLALFSIGFFYFLYQSLTRPTHKSWLLTGIFAGICLSFNFMTLTYFGIMGIAWLLQLVRKKATLLSAGLLGLGVVVGDLPYVIFELRHNFYNLRTIINIGVNTGNGASIIAGYTIFAFLPVAIWLFALITNLIKSKFGLLAATIFTLVLIAYFHATTPHALWVRGIGMPKGWTIPLQEQLAQRICTDSQQTPDKSFEIAAMITADLRAMDLRWFVQQCSTPAGFDQYPFVDTLYLIDQGFVAQGESPGNWEIVSLEPYIVTQKEQLNEFLWFYKLERQPSSESTEN